MTVGLVKKLRAANADRKVRRRPSGYQFCLADSIDFVPAAAWDEATTEASFFLSRAYLNALEDHED